MTEVISYFVLGIMSVFGVLNVEIKIPQSSKKSESENGLKRKVEGSEQAVPK